MRKIGFMFGIGLSFLSLYLMLLMDKESREMLYYVMYTGWGIALLAIAAELFMRTTFGTNIVNQYKRGKRLAFLRRLSPINEAKLANLVPGDVMAIKKTNATVDIIALSMGQVWVDEADITKLWEVIESYSDGSVLIESMDSHNNRSIIGGAGVKFVKSNLIHIPEGFMRQEMFFRLYKYV